MNIYEAVREILEPLETPEPHASPEPLETPEPLQQGVPPMTSPTIPESPDETLAAFDAYARSKPADEHYDFMDNENCAYAQFLKDTGRAVQPMVYGWEWIDRRSPTRYDRHPIPPALTFNCDAGRAVLSGRPGTWGALVKRLDKVKASIEEVQA